MEPVIAAAAAAAPIQVLLLATWLFPLIKVQFEKWLDILVE